MLVPSLFLTVSLPARDAGGRNHFFASGFQFCSSVNGAEEGHRFSEVERPTGERVGCCSATTFCRASPRAV